MTNFTHTKKTQRKYSLSIYLTFSQVLKRLKRLDIDFPFTYSLLMFVAAEQAHIIEAGVVQANLVLLHLGLDAADSSSLTVLAPVAVLPPGHAGSLQRGVAAAAELDVVDGRVVSEKPLVGLHAQLEGGEHAGGAVLRVRPLTEAEDEG